ncbi:MAG: hypothetical protein ABSD96_17950 [Candidatus Korobacteraceae bacterium]|jgi:hypothetical protein
MKKQGRLLLLVVALVAAALPVSAVAQSGAGAGKVVRLTAPAFAAENETLLVCAASAGGGHVTADILDGFSGKVLMTQQLTLPTLGSAEPPSVSVTVDTPPDPCLTFTAPTSSLFIGRIALNPQPLPPGIVAPDLNPQPLPPGIVASLQIFTGSMSAPSNLRIVGFEPPDPCRAGCIF